MRDEALLNNYAIAILSLAIEEKKVEEYRKELKVLKEILDENEEFIFHLGNYEISLKEKYDLLDKTFARFDKNIISFLKVIVKNNRAFLLNKIIKESIYRFNDYLKIEEGKIYLAHKLDKASMNKIIKAIEKNENARVELETIIDPSLLGGFIVSIKDNVYDASLINKLEKMKASLKGGN